MFNLLLKISILTEKTFKTQFVNKNNNQLKKQQYFILIKTYCLVLNQLLIP